jgi:hypothetical protein
MINQVNATNLAADKLKKIANFWNAHNFRKTIDALLTQFRINLILFNKFGNIMRLFLSLNSLVVTRNMWLILLSKILVKCT